jgi:hypothetical protein
MHELTCDRIAYRYLVQPCAQIISWYEWRAERRITPDVLLFLEIHAQPRSWFVSETSLPAVLDRSYIPTTARPVVHRAADRLTR